MALCCGAVGFAFAGEQANLRQLTASSRASAIIISEIMYHPPARPDSNDIEFIELFNTEPFVADIAGYRLAGDIDYTFPSGTVISQRSFIVVARDPAALQTVYGIASVLGPLSTNLPNGTGDVRLENELGAVVLDIEYHDNAPWPVAADGLGHSLVLARPDYGEGDVRAWQASDIIGGSPGAIDAGTNAFGFGIVINEILSCTNDGQTPFVELYNHTTGTIDLAGWYLSDDTNLMQYALASGPLSPGGTVAIDAAALGTSLVLNPMGGRLAVYDSVHGRVADAVKYRMQNAGYSAGRASDGDPLWRELRASTPGAANDAEHRDAIVINEIMYHPISEDNRDEYIELHNAGTNAVDVGNWAFTDGIDYTIQPGSIIPPGGYLVVAKDAAWLISRHTNLSYANTVGGYTGTLANSSERIRLAKPMDPMMPGQNMIIVDEVTYSDGGRWGSWTDGEGSSLELVDPRGDNALAANWAGSIETGKSAWTTICSTGRLDNGTRTPNEVQIMMLGAGECLMDDVAVTVVGETANRVANGSFESGTTGWLIEGTHIRSHVETTEAYAGTRSLHVVATDGGDNICNRFECDLTSAMAASQYGIIRLKARWLCGNRRIVARLYGNWLEATGCLDVPSNLGTPGAANSRRRANNGPAIADVAHAPVLPAANEPVVITARVDDPDGIGNVALLYRIDPALTYTAVAMRDDGTGGDAVAGDGIYGCTITGRAAGTLMAFHVRAIDAATATNTFPARVPEQECLVRFGDTLPSGVLTSIKLWCTAANVNTWTARKVLSNDPLDGTLAYGPFRAVYNIGARYHGSPWVRATGNPTTAYASYTVHLPPDDELMGAGSFMFDRLERDSTYTRERMSFWIARQMGVPYINMRYVNVYFNGNHKGVVYSDSHNPNKSYLERWFPGREKGDLFEVKDWFEDNDADNPYYSDQIADANLVNYTTDGGVKKQARYRWPWDKKPRDTADDSYASLFNLVDALNAIEDYGAAVEPLVDADEWLRAIAMRHVVSDWDGYGCDRGKNCYIYKPDNGAWQMIQWDLDMALGASSSTDYSLFTTSDPVLSGKFFSYVPYRRQYWLSVLDAANGALTSTQFNPRIDDLYAGLSSNGVVVADISPVKDWIRLRRDYILGQAQAITAAFAIVSQGGTNFVSATNAVVIEGTAPVQVDAIRVNGCAYEIAWPALTRWRVTVGLQPGANLFEVQGFNSDSLALAGMTDSVVITYIGTDTLPHAELVINEIMYNPAQADAEFIELHNLSQSVPAFLSNYWFEGVTFSFLTNASLGPGSYMVLAQDEAAFYAAYGADIPVAGQYVGKLSNEGETLRLLHMDPLAGTSAVMDEVTYSSLPPWPTAANDGGPSLQLIAPQSDNERVGNWAIGTVFPYTPGRKNNVSGLISALPDLWINEIQSANTATIADRMGDHDPWIELLAQSPVASTIAVVTVVADGATWRYRDDGSDQGTAWIAPSFNDAAWKSGAARLGYGGDGERTVVSYGANASDKYPTTYFRRSFVVGNIDDIASLTLELIRDDGAVIYLNGVEVRRDNMAEGTPGYRQYASATEGGAGEQTWYPSSVDSSLLIEGTNVFAVEVHQANGTSSDVSFDLRLKATKRGEFSSLNGYFLTDDPAVPAKWAFPTNAIAPSGSYVVAWLDGEPAETVSNEWHASFKLANGGYVGVARVEGATTALVDGVQFAPMGADRTFGCLPNGNTDARRFLYLPTPGAPNMDSNITFDVRINEWMADNVSTITNPVDGSFSDWFELYNASAYPIDLTGWTVGDAETESMLPSGTIIFSGAFMLVWADEQTNWSGTGPDLHAGFRLGKDGDEIHLRMPGGTAIDSVVFGTQEMNVTQGSYPDGATNMFTLNPPTPRAPNSLPEPAAMAAMLVLVALMGRRRRGSGVPPLPVAGHS